MTPWIVVFFRVVDSLPTAGTKSEESQLDMDMETMSSSLSESDIEAVITCVDEITKVYTLAPTLIVSIDEILKYLLVIVRQSISNIGIVIIRVHSVP